MKYYLLYKTTNKQNDKFYIGKHITENLNDGYLGSGIKLRNAIKKYGKENFNREIIKFCKDENELNFLEKQYVNFNLIKDNNSYNLALGGYGGCISLFSENPNYNDICKKISIAHKKISKLKSDKMKILHKQKRIGMYGKSHSEETKLKISISGKIQNASRVKVKRIVSDSTRKKISDSHLGKIHSVETKLLISQNHHDVSGNNNPMFGKLHSKETIQKLKNAASNREKVQCIHCNKVVDKSNYGRWHGDKCKYFTKAKFGKV